MLKVQNRRRKLSTILQISSLTKTSSLRFVFLTKVLPQRLHVRLDILVICLFKSSYNLIMVITYTFTSYPFIKNWSILKVCVYIICHGFLLIKQNTSYMTLQGYEINLISFSCHYLSRKPRKDTNT